MGKAGSGHRQNLGGIVRTMFSLRNIVSGLSALLRKEQVQRELDEELNAFTDLVIDAKVKQGMSRADAMRTVRLERGTTEVAKEMVYAAGWESLVEALWQDVRFGIRMLGKSPGFSVAAVTPLSRRAASARRTTPGPKSTR